MRLPTSSITKRSPIMPWTWHIQNATPAYWYLHDCLDLSFAKAAINQINSGSVVFPAPAKSQVDLVGMAMVYALRDITGKLKDDWRQTIVSNLADYPTYRGKHLAMALMDRFIRDGQENFNMETLPPQFEESLADLEMLVKGLVPLLPTKWYDVTICPVSRCKKIPGDSNLFANQTHWKVKTSSSKAPVNLDLVIQVLGYWLFTDGRMKSKVAIVLPRQQQMLEVKVSKLLAKVPSLEELESTLD